MKKGTYLGEPAYNELYGFIQYLEFNLIIVGLRIVNPGISVPMSLQFIHDL